LVLIIADYKWALKHYSFCGPWVLGQMGLLRVMGFEEGRHICCNFELDYEKNEMADKVSETFLLFRRQLGLNLLVKSADKPRIIPKLRVFLPKSKFFLPNSSRILPKIPLILPKRGNNFS
jgi:hypothetical protein